MNPPPRVPPGSEVIHHFARARRLSFEARPHEGWFRHWEPHDTLISPLFFLNSCTERTQVGVFVVAEPWTASEGMEPIERAVMGFAQVAGPRFRASIRTGEPFLTRVAFLESPPPPRVTLDDAPWDDRMTTFARTKAHAEGAFPPKLRALLLERSFRGHLEIRSGGFVVHHEGLAPDAYGYELTLRIAHDITRAFFP